MANVLVVDDHQDSREVLVLMLEMNGHRARSCESGEAAIQMLGDRPLDVMVLDDRMSGMSGLDVVRKVRQDPKFADMFLIVWSADSSGHHRAIDGGANDFWVKGSERVITLVEQLDQKLLEWQNECKARPAD